ncbi:ClpXP protease specificity-enhancing factor [Shewanella sp. NIFS-20-20]|uniref:ClpXP protease specificity-enhancing factor n=1 Tax=Shewanella sp. NIFS-20-20 TaxID=2853806 RepID=UPI001C44BB29|nr:ClpXP protease specificity-enhancing factor [Shewanella sp. NIFS-20-20]MBV7316757.1 ClpXP protease specificity-enhancing factor [Shewanella sp. NIFS-20-20]
MKPLTPNRPYLLRAYYDWLTDNLLTPHVVVDAYVTGTEVPQQFVKDGQIVLNIAQSAVGQLTLDNEYVQFNARFGGVPHHVVLPMAAIIAIYARENGAGMVFEMEDAYEVSDEEIAEVSDIEPPSPDDDKPKRKSHLTLVK